MLCLGFSLYEHIQFFFLYKCLFTQVVSSILTVIKEVHAFKGAYIWISLAKASQGDRTRDLSILSSTPLTTRPRVYKKQLFVSFNE